MSVIEEMADRMIKEALLSQASDIHIIPRNEESIVQFRISHRLVTMYSFSHSDSEKLISHFKFNSSMDIGERRRPQNGAFSLSVGDQKVGLRLSTLPGNKKESLVIRLLPQQSTIPFYQISLFPEMTEQLLDLLKHAHGLILLTGPTRPVTG